MKEITIWERMDRKKEFKHNHISDGFYKDELAPKAIDKKQEKIWKNATWRKVKAYLENGKVIYG